MKRALGWLSLLVTLGIGQSLLAQEATEGLYRVNADGSDLQRLLAGENYYGPGWSHDGTKIALTVIAEGESVGELYTGSSDGSGLTPLTSNGRNNYFPVWSPDDRMIAYISQDGSDTATAEVYVIQSDGSGETRLTNNEAWDYGVSWSPDGQRIAFGSEQGGTWGIHLMNADGSESAPLAEPAHGNAPTWSPDGQQIAFTSNRDGDDDIYVANMDGSDQRNLTNNTDWDDQPVWSPDGSRIAFTSYRSEVTGIYVLTLDTGETVSLTPSLDLMVGFSAWSPDSSQLLFHALALEESGDSPLPMAAIGAGVLLAGLVVVVIRRRRRA
jgi:Tol biopolymer transport system component